LVIIRNSTFGEISFFQQVNGSGINLVGNSSSDIQFSNNSIFVNDSRNPGLNKTANITIFGTPGQPFANPVVLRNGLTCNATTSPSCSNFTSLKAATVIFNVSAFSNYSIGEVVNVAPTVTQPAFSPNVIYTNTTTINITTNFTDSDGDKGNVTFTLFVNNIKQNDSSITNAQNGQNVSVFFGNNWNKTDNLTVQVNATDGNLSSAFINASVNVSNVLPLPGSPAITPPFPNSTNNLTSFSIVTDSDNGDKINVTITWFKNNIINRTRQFTNQANGTNVTDTLIPCTLFLLDACIIPGNFSNGDVFIVQYNVSEGGLQSIYKNSTSVTTTNETVAPNVTNLIPISNSTFNFSVIIEIGANVTDNQAVNKVLVDITFPNGTIRQLTLNNATNHPTKYNRSFTIPELEGQYNITFIANDTFNNVNASETTFFSAPDEDGDHIGDFKDTLIGNESFVNTTGITKLNITVDGKSVNGTFTGVKEVLFFDDTTLLVNFSHNFSLTARIKLRNVSLKKTVNSILINLSKQLLINEKKILYLTDNNFVELCAEDAEISTIDEISNVCNEVNETNLKDCIGGSFKSNNLSCVDEGTRFKVENFSFSALRGTPETGEEGGGGGRPTPGVVPCTYDWECSYWSPKICPSYGAQTRTCINKGTCTGEEEKPDESLACTPGEVLNESALFDIKLDLKSLAIEGKEALVLFLELINVKTSKKVDVDLVYTILDLENNVVFKTAETRAVFGTLSFKKVFDEVRLRAGEYIIRVEMTYASELKRLKASSEHKFKIIEREGKRTVIIEKAEEKDWLIIIGILSLVFIVSLLVILNINKTYMRAILHLQTGKTTQAVQKTLVQRAKNDRLYVKAVLKGINYIFRNIYYGGAYLIKAVYGVVRFLVKNIYNLVSYIGKLSYNLVKNIYYGIILFVKTSYFRLRNISKYNYKKLKFRKEIYSDLNNLDLHKIKVKRPGLLERISTEIERSINHIRSYRLQHKAYRTVLQHRDIYRDINALKIDEYNTKKPGLIERFGNQLGRIVKVSEYYTALGLRNSFKGISNLVKVIYERSKRKEIYRDTENLRTFGFKLKDMPIKQKEIRDLIREGDKAIKVDSVYDKPSLESLGFKLKKSDVRERLERIQKEDELRRLQRYEEIKLGSEKDVERLLKETSDKNRLSKVSREGMVSRVKDILSRKEINKKAFEMSVYREDKDVKAVEGKKVLKSVKREDTLERLKRYFKGND
ncbi:hypothetical protein HY498_01735, partial [Candidatus Woesearchaeota archaeon]|nr:hypothetical protein [Candidatus Woesearchaeota archaeon]